MPVLWKKEFSLHTLHPNQTELQESCDQIITQQGIETQGSIYKPLI
jgi:hypothetical protein